MKLHSVVGSPNCRRVEAVANHLGQKLDIEYHDFFAGDLRKPEYLALNANGMVPLLADGAFTLWESNAITQYLADKAGSDTLFPRDPQRRADVVRWQCWELSHFNKAFGTLAWETVAKPTFNLGPTNHALVEIMRDNLKRFAAVLDRHLADRDYLVGNGITIADYSMITPEKFKEAIPFDWAPFANVNAYFERMRKVEHWTRTAPANPAETGRKPKAA
ncbi:MAG: glutathione S-transferase family protein [Rhizobiales bacterium]|nr:glutathione S-transferase family protein [Hyphomicrobiales bacterium]